MVERPYEFGVLPSDKFFQCVEANPVIEVELEFDDCLFERLVVFDLLQLFLECFFDDFRPVLVADLGCDICLLNEVVRKSEVDFGAALTHKPSCMYIVPTNSIGFRGL
jgi:hypothetical protein